MDISDKIRDLQKIYTDGSVFMKIDDKNVLFLNILGNMAARESLFSSQEADSMIETAKRKTDILWERIKK